MSGGNTHFNSDWLSFIDCNVLLSFWCKRKKLSLLFMPPVMLQYKLKIKDFWHLINMQKRKPMFIYAKI